MDSLEDIQTQQLSLSGLTNKTRSTTPPGEGGAPSSSQGQSQGMYSFDNVQSTPRRIGGHSRTDSATNSESSNDGIEWEDEARYFDTEEEEEHDDGEEHSMDEDDEDEDDYEYDDNYQEQDTQRLLASSSNARTGGLGMGMRVGETGTGTTIGLDFEHNHRREYDQEYDALPLTTVDGERHGSKNKRSARQNSRRDRHRILHPGMPVTGLGSVRTEQEQLIAARQVRIKMMWNVFYVFACLRPKAAPSAKDFGTKIMPCAVASGLDVGLSNSSLKSITLAFYKRPTWTLAGVIGVICVGLFMMVMSEVDFVLIGFIQVMLASVLGGLRWSLTQLLLERTDTKSGSLANPISTIFFLSPIMGICLCIVAGIFEGFGTIFSSEFFQTFQSGLFTLGLLFLGGIFAFAMVLAEFNLIARTSVVSLSVLGIIKEVVTIVVSSLVFHDHLTVVNILGLFVTLAGIGFYHFMKLREMKIQSRKAAREIADLHLAAAVNNHGAGGGRGQNNGTVRDHRKKRRSGGGVRSGQPEIETVARRGGFEEHSNATREGVFRLDGDDDDDVRGGAGSERSRDGVDDSSQELIGGLEAASPPTHQRGGP
ncbi:Triose-phosphate Transporter [Linnemannia hyalina]|uniref:Triose-phosphate Transporter n=1 Tax=Linnemannia hyalina TaxID=64524 RepID=A0A9P7XSA4_9FUNG|nr:Triose-phosphate Transporter [Linnemannia hyalina]